MWPGQFDVGFEFESEDARASFGASPGDHNSDEPYLSVSAWWPDRLTLETPDYSAFASNCGVLGILVDAIADLRGAFAAAIAGHGPALVEVMSDVDLL